MQAFYRSCSVILARLLTINFLVACAANYLICEYVFIILFNVYLRVNNSSY